MPRRIKGDARREQFPALGLENTDPHRHLGETQQVDVGVAVVKDDAKVELRRLDALNECDLSRQALVSGPGPDLVEPREVLKNADRAFPAFEDHVGTGESLA